MTYTPDRPLNPPEFYDMCTATVYCALCDEDMIQKEANEIGRTLKYLCDKCNRDVEDMTGEEKEEFVNDHLQGREVFRNIINNKTKNKKNEQK